MIIPYLPKWARQSPLAILSLTQPEACPSAWSRVSNAVLNSLKNRPCMCRAKLWVFEQTCSSKPPCLPLQAFQSHPRFGFEPSLQKSWPLGLSWEVKQSCKVFQNHIWAKSSSSIISSSPDKVPRCHWYLLVGLTALSPPWWHEGQTYISKIR